jgi:hypothetical protein
VAFFDETRAAIFLLTEREERRERRKEKREDERKDKGKTRNKDKREGKREKRERDRSRRRDFICSYSCRYFSRDSIFLTEREKQSRAEQNRKHRGKVRNQENRSKRTGGSKVRREGEEGKANEEKLRREKREEEERAKGGYFLTASNSRVGRGSVCEKTPLFCQEIDKFSDRVLIWQREREDDDEEEEKGDK